MNETAEIVGRADELEALLGCLDAPDASRVLLVEGVAGIGKTTVLFAAARAAEASGRRVLHARPAPVEATLSFSGVHDLLEPVLADMLAVLPPPQRKALSVALLLEEPDGRPPDRRACRWPCSARWGPLVESSRILLVIDDIQCQFVTRPDTS